MNKFLIVLGFFISLIIAFIVITLFFKKPEPEIIIETVTKIKTVTQIDTVFIEVPIFVEVPVQTPIIEKETGLNKYVNVVSDTLITATITTWVDGTMERQTLDYTPLFPKYINRTDSVFINTTKTITKNHYPTRFYLGVEANISYISPKAIIAFKNYSVGYRYSFDSLENPHNISFLIRF